MKKQIIWRLLQNKNKPYGKVLVARLTVECHKFLNRLLLQTYYPWVFAYYSPIQFSVPCRQNSDLCQYRLSQITFCLPICPPPNHTAGANYIMSACTQSRIHRIVWKKVCMISAKLDVFWPASLRRLVTKACVIGKECFVARRRRMAMSCGKKTNLSCSLATGHDDPQNCARR